MSKTTWVVLLLIAMCAAFAAGMMAGRISKPGIPSQQPAGKAGVKKRESGDVGVLLASLAKFRRALDRRKNEARKLETELAEVREKLPPPLSPEEQKKKQEQEEEQKRWERRRARYEKTKALREKILQRRDKALRAQGLEELAALLDSRDPEQLILGLMTFSSVGQINFEKERFKPHVVAGLFHENEEVRRAAFDCLYFVCPSEEHLDLVLRMVDDPSPKIREMLPWRVAWAARGERRDEVMDAMRTLLQDEEKNVSKAALSLVFQHPEFRELGEDAEHLAIEMSRDPESADEMMRWLSGRDVTSEKVVRRLIEMYDEGRRGYEAADWTHRRLSDDAKPVVIDFCLRLLRESIEPYERRSALQGLLDIGDVSVITDLQEIARSPDAEGIEDELARTIEHLQKRMNQPR